MRLARDRRPLEQAVQTEVRRRQPHQGMREALEQRARRAVREADAIVAVEGEHRDVDLRQHLVEERGRFHGLEPLRAQCRTEAVRFEHDVAERIALARVASADTVVAAAQRLQQVRDRAHRLDGRLVDRDREADPGADQHHDDEPLHRVRDRRVAQQQDGSEQRRQSTGERQQHDARLKPQAAPSRDRAAVQGLSRLAFFRHGAGVCAFTTGCASCGARGRPASIRASRAGGTLRSARGRARPPPPSRCRRCA